MDYGEHLIAIGEPMNVPVYITNKNRLTSLKRLVDWLLETPDVGLITVLDQGTTYQPLLTYYKSLPKRVDVRFLEPNPHLCWVFWELHMEDEQTGPYIVTDGDYVPADHCPKDLISKMVVLLEEYYPKGYTKVGPGIRTDNIPDSPFFSEAVQGQQQYWQHRLTPECFDAAIDTSFAVYKKEFGFNNGWAIRLDYPYLFEHQRWYVWPLDDEERYYIEHDDYGAGHTVNMKQKGYI